MPAPEWVLERIEEMSRSEPPAAPSVLPVAQLVGCSTWNIRDCPSDHANRQPVDPADAVGDGVDVPGDEERDRSSSGSTRTARAADGGAVYHEDRNILNVWTTSAPEFNLPGSPWSTSDGSIYCKPFDVYGVRHGLRTFEEAVKHYGRNQMRTGAEGGSRSRPRLYRAGYTGSHAGATGWV